MSQVWSQNGGSFDINEKVSKVAQLVWNPDSLAWEKMTQPGGATSASTVLTKRFEQVSDTLLYFGAAPIGTPEDFAGWQVRAVSFNANGDAESIKFANGGASTAKWSDRAILAYQ